MSRIIFGVYDIVKDLTNYEISHFTRNDDDIVLDGLGCALIRTEVFRQLQFPWFQCYSPKLNKIGADMVEEGGVNEDAHFSELLFENGYKIKILRDIKCGHVVDFQNKKIFGLDQNIEYSNFDWVNQFNLVT